MAGGQACRPVCVSTCGVRETEDIHGERHTQRHKTDTKRHTHTEIKRNRNTERDTHICRDTQWYKRERDNDSERWQDKNSDTDTQSETERG